MSEATVKELCAIHAELLARHEDGGFIDARTHAWDWSRTILDAATKLERLERIAALSPAMGEETARQIIHELAADIRDRLSSDEGSANWRNAHRIVELSRPTIRLSELDQINGEIEALMQAAPKETALAAHVTETPEIEHVAGDVLSAAGWREKLDRILDEDAPNKWVWKTHASMDEWLRAEILPLLRTIRSIAKENSKAGAPSL